jgi:dihydrofolate reductase
MVSLIVATSLNNAIGKDNKMLWHLPEDFKYFKNTTWGMPIIMGRKTFESIGKALPGRTNIVITNNKNWHAENVEVVHTIEDAITLAKKTNATEIFITGGAEIYKQSISIADKIYITKVNTNIDGDTFFPEIDENIWFKTFEKNILADDKNAFDMSFQQWERK